MTTPAYRYGKVSPWPLRIAIGLGILLAVALAVAVWKIRDANAAHAKAALAEANAKAYADSTRELRQIVTKQGDTLRTFSRLAIQQQQKQDEIDALVGATRIALERIEARIKALDVTATGTPTVETAEGDRRSSFDIREEPYTVHADVRLPRPPAKGEVRLAIKIDSIPLTVRQSCDAPNEHGIRYAHATVTGPTWAPVLVRQAEQDPGMCRSPALEDQATRDAKAHDRRLRLALVAGVGIGQPIAPLVPDAQFRPRPSWSAYAGLALAKPIPFPSWLSWIPGS